ncbi:GMP synthase [glutamine-hydrolyzing] [Candidatus Westeberhardia cardiocondylae]|uniref:GMP synthase [glutamine-hydrolyzing] n=1 Tax=Candidatus Westeberhardia cardiocondylae TaxID=1594731 RepID=A0A0H5BWW1_9ENTR|nr:glutamine-hydrolyzing GMP synthase [Candidatus Westeberhardia cardiocondylae]CEN32089.1 GMP synthase [glutamine-hydrolyzing] [Candidatus Westeberhardia cardiocondylae]
MLKHAKKYRILILDFGSQYSQLLARRIRELGIYCELWKWNADEKQIKKFNPKGIILSGGPESATTKNSPKAPKYVFLANIPVLGICYGMHIMTKQLGGKIQTSSKREFGLTKICITSNSPLLHNIKNTKKIQNNLNVWMSHEDKIITIPKNFTTIAKTQSCPFAIISNEKKNFYGIQFHPEVTHTQQGKSILKNFVIKICKCESLWNSDNIIKNLIKNIKKKIGNNEKVMLGFSGGIDSLVTALLLKKAIGKRLLCIFIDNGLLQFKRNKKHIQFFKKNYNLKIIYISAKQQFFNAISGITDPETKRKIIGKIFIETFNKKASKLSKIKWLAQGTIYSDVIESAQSIQNNSTHLIKSHHNVGGLPKKMNIKLIEPIKKLFKDEVRNIGKKLGLSHNILYRHPFPGPGLGIRILGEIKQKYCDILRKSDKIFIEELKNFDLYHKVNQAFTIFIPVRSVGIMGDKRKYDCIIALRAIESIDFMTACCSNLPYNLLTKVSNRIINEITGISRVVYDISSKPPATIEWE